MYSDNNLIYLFTILEAIEKINLYTEDIDINDDEEFYYSKFNSKL